jgi:hypothetical protein
MTRRSLLFALGLAAALTASQAEAATTSITGLFSTGLNGTGGLLLDTQLDTHYAVTPVLSDPTVGPATFAVVGHFPIPPWADNTATAQWITPKMPEPINGLYNYVTTFTVSDPLTASITGAFLSADDQVNAVLLNNVSLGITTPDGFLPGAGFTSLHPFSIPVGSGFVAGLNTLEFRTENVHGVVTGLIVDFGAVPEPGSLAMLGIGLTGLFAFRRFFRRASVA